MPKTLKQTVSTPKPSPKTPRFTERSGPGASREVDPKEPNYIPGDYKLKRPSL